MESHTRAIELKNELDQLRPIPREREEIIMQKFRLDWNYHSNNLEGNSLTFGETKALILFGITAQGKPLKDHFEITGHDKAIKWVMDVVKGEYPLNENFIRELHTLLLKEPYEVDAITPDGKLTKRLIQVGKYKSVPNHVLTKTGEIFHFSSVEETPSKMHDLIEWYRDENTQQDVNPILLAAEFHYRFIRIHPFDDGNGRLARILMNFILIHFGYPPLIIKTEDKLNYFATLRQADAGIIEPFFEYIASNLIRSLEIMISGAKGESIEEEDDLDKEIALLKARLNSDVDNNQRKLIKNKEVIQELYERDIKKLWHHLNDYYKKFKDFYYNSEIILSGEGGGWSGYDGFPEVGKHITDSADHFYLEATFTGLKFTNKEGNNYDLIIDIQLTPVDKYYIKIIKTKESHEFKYDQHLSEFDISKIMKSITKAHKEFIENIS